MIYKEVSNATPQDEDRATAIGNVHRKFREVGIYGFEICEQKDRHTGTLLAVFRTLSKGETITHFKRTFCGCVQMVFIQNGVLHVMLLCAESSKRCDF